MNLSCADAKRLLRKGPLCLQETKWSGAEIEHLYQQIPGVRVCHSAAVRCGERARTGGVAVLLPPGWEILEELELVPGRAVAVKIQDRTCQFLLISVYIHPERRKQDAEALLRAWRRLDRTNQFVFLIGDFNGIDTHCACSFFRGTFSSQKKCLFLAPWKISGMINI